MRSVAAILFLAGLIALSMGCGGGGSPSDCLKEADTALFTDKNYEKAGKLYMDIINWKKEGEKPTEDQRFAASLNLIRCKVLNKDYSGSIASLEEMQKAFDKKVTCKNYGTIFNELANERAINEAITVIEMACKKFPDAKDALENQVERLKKMDLTDDDLARLKTLGYL